MPWLKGKQSVETGQTHLGPKPHAVLVRSEDFGRDSPLVLDEAAHVPAAVIPLAALEIPLPRQIEQYAARQDPFQLRTRSTSLTSWFL